MAGVKKYQKRTKGKAIPKGFKAIDKLQKEITQLKRSTKQEVKESGLVNSVIGQTIGQVIGATANGFFAANITPPIIQGVGYEQRVGSEISLHKMRLHLQFTNQTACQQPIRWVCYVVAIKGTDRTATQVVGDMFSVNPFILLSGGGISNIKDYNSFRNYDFAQNYKVLKVFRGKQSLETFSSAQMMTSVQKEIKFKVPRKIVWASNTNTVTSGSIYFFVLCDGGNADPTNASTLQNLPTVAPNTGMTMNFGVNHYYHDA